MFGADCAELQLPHINGSDVAGEIAEVGEYVTWLKKGQRILLAPMTFCGHCSACVSGQQNFCPEFSVLGYLNDGGNRELMAIPAVNVIPIPDSLTFEQAASVPLVFLTAWHMLVTRAQIRPGQTVLVLGAGSGVGTAAIQIAKKIFGATVITTAGDEKKLEMARAARSGLHHRSLQAKDLRRGKEDYGEAGSGYRVRTCRAGDVDESMKSLKPGGTIVTCGATTGPEVKVDLRFLYSRQLSYLGSFMGNMGDLHSVLSEVFSGKLKPVVDRTFPLKDAAEAHRYLESSQMFGKVVLVV